MAKDLPLARGAASRRDRRPGSGPGRKLLYLLLTALVALLLLALLRVGGKPDLSLEVALPGLGPATPVTVQAREDGRGLSEVSLELVQGNRAWQIASQTFEPRPFWAFWGPRTTETRLESEVGATTLEGLSAGEAILRATAGRAGTWLRWPQPVVEEVVLPVRLTPPTLEVLARTPATQGGSGVVVYRAGETSATDGVQAGEWWFPGAPLPGGQTGERFAFFGAPYDLADGSSIQVVARDVLGNQVSLAFLRDFRPQPPTQDDIRVGDAFLAQVVPLILAQNPDFPTQGDLLQNYLAINRRMRAANAQELVDLGRASVDAFLWSGRFLQLPRSQVMSSFADQRTYFYQGEEIDRQVHLGYDLASVAQAPVPAANAGTVVKAAYFGIYGNTVVVDHGYGLQTLYSHLSSVAVAEGDSVAKGQILGRTGSTGLSGGDHLHFTVMLRGLPVDPVEWWDAGWIRSRVQETLGSGPGGAD